MIASRGVQLSCLVGGAGTGLVSAGQFASGSPWWGAAFCSIALVYGLPVAATRHARRHSEAEAVVEPEPVIELAEPEPLPDPFAEDDPTWMAIVGIPMRLWLWAKTDDYEGEVIPERLAYLEQRRDVYGDFRCRVELVKRYRRARAVPEPTYAGYRTLTDQEMAAETGRLAPAARAALWSMGHAVTSAASLAATSSLTASASLSMGDSIAFAAGALSLDVETALAVPPPLFTEEVARHGGLGHVVRTEQHLPKREFGQTLATYQAICEDCHQTWAATARPPDYRACAVCGRSDDHPRYYSVHEGEQPALYHYDCLPVSVWTKQWAREARRRHWVLK